MSNVNKQAQELTKAFFNAVEKKVTPGIFKQSIGQFKNLLNVYTYEELEKVIEYIKEKKMTNIYSVGYLSYATNKLLQDIKLEEIKKIKTEVIQADTLELNIDNKKEKKSSFLDKFM